MFYLRVLRLAAAFGVLAISGASLADDEAPLVLEPSSEWHIDYADDSCRLARGFGSGEDRSVFYLERYEPGDYFFLVVSGQPFNAGEGYKVRYTFGPQGTIKETMTTTGTLGEYGPAQMVSGMTLQPLPSNHVGRDGGKRSDPAKREEDNMFGQILTPEQEGTISWFEVQVGKRRPVRVALGSMQAPMAAMRQCTDELLTHWGLDIAAHRTLSRPARPLSNPGTWMNSNDYPRQMLQQGARALIQVRLTVGKDGKPLSCHIQRSTRPEEFDRAVCRALMKRAEFDPALDANGQPMVSYWRNAVRFEMS